MAQRNRRYIIRYGGEKCGTGANGSPTVISTTPSFNGTHSCIDETHPGPPYRSGGPLSVVKKKVYIKRFPPFTSHYFSTQGWYDGFMGVTPYIPPVEPTPLNLSGWGARGWNRTFPLHPVYQLGVSLIELKDLPRMLTQTKAFFRSIQGLKLSKVPKTVGEFLADLQKGPKYIGEHYLNLQFGWVPFLQDLLFITQMKDKVHKKMAWLTRKNGKGVRREVELDKGGFSENIPRNVSSTVTVFPTLSSFLYAPGMGLPMNYPILKTYDHRIWFAAKYKFWIPELAPNQYLKRDHLRLEAELVGLALDPTILYKVTPWSWLLDWFTSTGSVVQNIYLRAKYHVVAEYAYVMCRENFTYQAPGYIGVHTGTYAGGWKDPDRFWTGVSSTIYEFRTREVANPYGFGLTYASLSAYQWSILAALGLTRGGKHSAPRA